MVRRRNTLIIGMSVLLLLVVALIIWYSYQYNASYANDPQKVDFWKDFSPQICATVFGILASILLAVALWAWQQKDQDRYKREQLLKNLRFEVEQNLKTLTENVFILDMGWDEKKYMDDYLLFTGKLAEMLPLRQAAMGNFLKSENLVLVNIPELEQNVARLCKNIEGFNATIEAALIPLNPWATAEIIRNSIQTMQMGLKVGYQRNKTMLTEIIKFLDGHQ